MSRPTIRQGACYLLAVLPLASAVKSLGYDVPPIVWKDCGEQLRCGNLTVPLDWDQPNGPRIQLYVNKLKAKTKDPEYRLGTLFYEPGGPGISGSQEISQFTENDGMALLGRYDMVGLDPRSIGYSSPLNCDDEILGHNFLRWPTRQEDFDELFQRNRKFAQSCLDRSGDTARHVDTVSAAKDLEALRVLLGSPKLNLLGFSYGTQLAATYISLFPEHVGRIVMDGNLDHTTDRITAFTSEAKTVEACFGRWADWCDRNKTCAFGNDTGPRTRERWTNMLNDIDTGKLRLEFTRNCEPEGCGPEQITGDDVSRTMRGVLYSPNYGWPHLGRALSELERGNTDLLFNSNMARYTPPNQTAQAGLVVTCLDFDYAKTFPQFQQLHDLGRSIAPLTRGYMTQSGLNNLECVGFPFTADREAAQKPLGITYKDLPPVLMVQNTHDPATSYQSALNLHRQIPNSRLLVREGDGHISYRVSGKIRSLVDGFLLNGTLPEEGMVVVSNSMGEGYGT